MPTAVRSLTRHLLADRKTLFDLHLIPETTGRINVDDKVEVN